MLHEYKELRAMKDNIERREWLNKMTKKALVDYYTKQFNSAVDKLEDVLSEDPYNKHAYKLLCQIYRDRHHEYKLNSTIRRYGKTAGTVE